jgi:hypothetical protein
MTIAGKTCVFQKQNDPSKLRFVCVRKHPGACCSKPGGLKLTLGSNLTCCLSLCISARLFISKLQRRKLLLIQTRSLREYFQIYKETVGKFV